MWVNYILVEGLLTIVGFTAFYIWQMRSLKRDVAEREAREKAAALKDNSSSQSQA
ncbi:MAG: hypothetical protein AAGI92_09990 [Pseudomonadota bacterium]